MYQPSKKEIKILNYLYKIKDRYEGRKYDTRENIKTNLSLKEEDLGDMQGSNFLYFAQNMKQSLICITREGNLFVENYPYEKKKEFFYWVLVISSIITVLITIYTFFK